MERCVADPSTLAARATLQLEASCAGALKERGAFHIAIPGGSVAKALFPAFARAKLDWSKVHVWWVDERLVPPDNAESNFKAAQDAWLSKVQAQVHRVKSELPLAEAVTAYEGELAQHLPSGVLDVVLLGVGPDGHIAALFPGHRAMQEAGHKVVGVDDSPKPPPQRLSLSLPLIIAARDVWVFAMGKEKSAVIHESVMKQGSELPLAKIIRDTLHVRLWLDGAAAS